METEGIVIAEYKRLQAKLPNTDSLAGLVLQEFDPTAYPTLDVVSALKQYLEQAQHYMRKLVRAAIARQRHYDLFIENKRPEDAGHQHWRESMNDVAAAAVETLEHWDTVYNNLMNKQFDDGEKYKQVAFDDSYRYKPFRFDITAINVDKLSIVEEKRRKKFVSRPKLSEQQKKLFKKEAKRWNEERRRFDLAAIADETERNKAANEKHAAFVAEQLRRQQELMTIAVNNSKTNFFQEMAAAKDSCTRITAKEILANFSGWGLFDTRKQVTCPYNGFIFKIEEPESVDDYRGIAQRYINALKLNSGEAVDFVKWAVLWDNIMCNGSKLFLEIAATEYLLYLFTDVNFKRSWLASGDLAHSIALVFWTIPVDQFIDLLHKINYKKLGSDIRRAMIIDFFHGMYPIFVPLVHNHKLAELLKPEHIQKAIYFYDTRSPFFFTPDPKVKLLKQLEPALCVSKIAQQAAQAIRVWHSRIQVFVELVRRAKSLASNTTLTVEDKLKGGMDVSIDELSPADQAAIFDHLAKMK